MNIHNYTRRLAGFLILTGCAVETLAAEPELTGSAPAPSEPLSLFYRQPDWSWLEALPSAWTTGSASELRARGGFEVGLACAGGKLTRVTIKSVGGQRGNDPVWRSHNGNQIETGPNHTVEFST